MIKLQNMSTSVKSLLDRGEQKSMTQSDLDNFQSERKNKQISDKYTETIFNANVETHLEVYSLETSFLKSSLDHVTITLLWLGLVGCGVFFAHRKDF